MTVLNHLHSKVPEPSHTITRVPLSNWLFVTLLYPPVPPVWACVVIDPISPIAITAVVVARVSLRTTPFVFESFIVFWINVNNNLSL